MNKRGQALVEFVLILPIILFLLLAVYDFGMIFSKENEIESNSTDIVMAYKNGKTVDEINSLYDDMEVSVNRDNGYDKITVKGTVKVVTPGLNLVLGNPYQIVVERYINYE